MASIEVDVLGTFAVRVDGAPISLSSSERRALAALCILDRPIDLMSFVRDILHVSPSTIRPLLSRLARRLGVARVHEPSEPRSGQIVLVDARADAPDAPVVVSDIGRFRDTARAILATPASSLDVLLECDTLWSGPIDASLELVDGSGGALVLAIERTLELRDAVRAAALELMPRPLSGPHLHRVRRWTDDRPDDPRPWWAVLLALIETEPRAVDDHLERWRRCTGPAVVARVDLARALVEARSRRPTTTIERPRLTAGRQVELDTLHSAFDDVARGRGGCLRLVGAAGHGKTHLLREACAARPDVRVGWADLEQSSVAEDVWSSLLAERWCALLADESPSAQLARLVEPVEALFGWRPTPAQPGYGYSFATRTIRSLLRLPGGVPLVLVVENVHLADDSLARVFADIAVAAKSTGVLVLASARPRPADDATWADVPRLEIGPLVGDAIAELVTAELGLPAGSAELERIVRRARGNPLVASALASSDRPPGLTGSGDSGAAEGEQASQRVMIEALSQEDRRVLAVVAAATTGMEFDLGLVDSLLDPDARARRRIRALLERGTVVAPGRDGWGRFTHRRWQEVCYEHLAAGDRRELHRRAFRALRRLDTHHASADRALELAYHAEHSGLSGLDRATAVSWLAEAGDRLLEARQYTRAMTVYGRALELAPVEFHVGLRMARAGCARMEGRWVDAAQDLLAAADLANAAGDTTEEAEALLALALVTWAPGPTDARLRARLSTLLEQLPPSADVLRARVAACLGGGLYQDGSSAMDETIEPLIRAAIDHARPLPNPAHQALLMIHARKALLGHDPPRSSLRRARAILRADGEHGEFRAEGLLAVAVDLIRIGRLAAARRVCAGYGALAERTSSPVHAYVAATLDAMWAIADGRLDDARQAVASAESLGGFGGATSLQVVRGQSLLIALDAHELAADPDLARGVAALLPADGPIPLWTATRAWLLARSGLVFDARLQMDSLAEATDSFRRVRRGPMRIGLLALAIETEWILHGAGVTASPEHSRNLAAALASEHDRVVLIGWPTVILGPTDLFRAMLIELEDGAPGRSPLAIQQRASAAHLARSTPGLARRCIEGDGSVAVGG